MSEDLNTPSIIIYLSAIKTLVKFNHEEIEFNRVYFRGFCTKYDTWFSKYRIKLVVSLSSTNATKIELDIVCTKLDCTLYAV